MSYEVIYPKNKNEFINWYSSNSKWNDIYLSMTKHHLFDVSLRDGLQGLNKIEQEYFTLDNKIKLYHKIIAEQNPTNIEIGSIVSPNILPIMKDTLELYKYINTYNNNIFILFPNKQKVDSVNINDINYSLITSVSESFQLKNIKKTLNDTKKDISEIIEEKTKNNKKYIKIYISCINYCPIEGKINNDFIVNEILYYSELDINNICISDTCGCLNFLDFEYILNKCIENNIDINIISLHLHINHSNLDNIKKILFLAFEKNIKQYDVSMLETGGCSITINNTELKSNLSYELYYKFLVDYIMYKSN